MQAVAKISPSAINRLGQLGLRSGPGPLRRHEIRLITRIDNSLKLLPRRSRLRHTELALAQRRLEARTPPHLTPKRRWLEPQGCFTLQHGAQLRNTMLGALPDAHRISARANPSALTAARANDVVEMQPQRLRPLPACRANEQRPCPALRKRQQTDANNPLNTAKLNKERRRSGVMMSRARKRLARTDGKSSRYLDTTATSDWINQNPPSAQSLCLDAP